MIKPLFNRVIKEEFVVDEAPCDISYRNCAGDGPTAFEQEQDDLFSLLCDLLRRHEDLDDINRRLQETQGQSDEMESLIVKLLSALDSFDRVLFLARNHTVSDEMSNWLRSIEGLYFRVTEILESVGLVALKTVGRTVDLDLHEVVSVQYAPEQPVDTIVSERRKGYVFRGKLLRCAMVVVATRERP